MARRMCRGIILDLLLSLAAFPANSRISAVRYSITAAWYTGAPEAIRKWCVVFLKYRWTLLTGNINPAFCERDNFIRFAALPPRPDILTIFEKKIKIFNTVKTAICTNGFFENQSASFRTIERLISQSQHRKSQFELLSPQALHISPTITNSTKKNYTLFYIECYSTKYRLIVLQKLWFQVFIFQNQIFFTAFWSLFRTGQWYNLLSAICKTSGQVFKHRFMIFRRKTQNEMYIYLINSVTKH